jgi:uncharacterized protein (DUF433 family)
MTVLSPWRTDKVLARIRRGESPGSIYNDTGAPLASILALRLGIAPDPPVSNRRFYSHRYVRQARKAGMTVAGCMKHYGLTKEEVLAITRKRPTGKIPRSNTKRDISDLLADGYTREQIAVHFPEIGTA